MVLSDISVHSLTGANTHTHAHTAGGIHRSVYAEQSWTLAIKLILKENFEPPIRTKPGDDHIAPPD